MARMIPKRTLVILALALLLLTGATVVRRPAGGPVLHTIALGTDPGSVAVDGATGRAFVVDRDTNGYAALGQGSVSIIDTRAGTVLRTATVGADPREVVIDARNGHVLVANDDDSSVSVLDARSGALLGTVHVGSHPHNVAVDERTNRAFVVNSGDGSVSILDARRAVVLRTVRLGADFALSGVAVNTRAGRVFVGDTSGSTGVTHVLDARTGALYGTPTGAHATLPYATSYPFGLYATDNMAIDPTPAAGAPDGRVFMVSSAGLRTLDARTGRTLRVSGVGGIASAVALDASRHRLYVTSIDGVDANGVPTGHGRVTVLDERSGAVLRVVDAGMTPRALGIDTGTGHVVIADAGGSVSTPNAWAWIPAGIRRRLPFLNSPLRTRAVPASVSVLDLSH
jgi:YVTN family beta-propeller protein